MAETLTETSRIAEQLRNAFSGEPWHGYPILTLIKAIDYRLAAAKPLPSIHSVWEILLHLDVYVRVATEAIQGKPMPRMWGTEVDWPSPTELSHAAWTKDLIASMENADRLAALIEGMPDAKLQEVVPGRDYDFYYLLHGIIQHSLYHAGQIAILTSAGRKVDPN